jgi:hypothetical protein
LPGAGELVHASQIGVLQVRTRLDFARPTIGGGVSLDFKIQSQSRVEAAPHLTHGPGRRPAMRSQATLPFGMRTRRS